MIIISSNKIINDKYYTSKELAEYITNKTKEIIGEENIPEYLEPSAGGGVFLDLLDKPYLAYDIEPEDDRIIQQDYLTLDLEYKKGRCIIGNPPYGRVMNLAVQFYKKSIQLGDYIAFILPVSQYNNNIKLFEFDLIHSEIIENKGFIGLDKRIKLCFNIYKRSENGTLNKKPNYKLKDIEIKEAVRSKNPRRNKIITKNNFNYDIRICNFGWNIGNEVEYEGQYSNELCIKINNNKYKNQIIELLRNVKWKEIYYMTGTEKISVWQVYKYIKEQIHEIN